MRNKYIFIELIFSLVIFTFASLGLLYSPYWLVLGYILHGVWDILHHPKIIQTKVIKWFPPFCAVVDFIVGIYIYISY
jgi:hypothetical protein